MQQFNVGKQIWVVERDADEPVEVTSSIYLATCENVVITTPLINDYDFADILAYHIDQTSEYGETNLMVYPLEDCFSTKEEALNRLEELLNV